MNLNTTRIYKVDVDSDSVNSIDQTAISETDLAAYLDELVSSITTNRSGRHFTFERDTLEVNAIITKLMAGDPRFSELTQSVADRLLTCETTAQEDIAHLGVEIQKGLLFIALIERVDKKMIMICKSDDIEVLSEETFRRVKGLPIKKRIFKAFLYTKLVPSGEVSIKVLDTNNTMARYWWKDFLELTELYDDESNTKRAFAAVDANVFSKLKKKHPQDYLTIRNSAIRYFRGEAAFEIEDFIDNVVGDYVPHDSALDIPDLKNRIRALPERKNFDTQFGIVSGVVKAKFRGNIPLTPEIDLVIKEDIDIPNTIKPVIGDDGSKFIQIRTDEGFKYFSEGTGQV